MSIPPFTILGIESSCDETAAAIVRGGRDVSSNVIATQTELHQEYGGIVPEIASRAHIERIYPVVREALELARITMPTDQLDAVAVGHRPGLIGSLIVGVAAAKALAWGWERPIIGVDHVIAHLSAASLDAVDSPAFPALGLVVSGGHTSLFSIRTAHDVALIGRTIDDAIGEAYDKAAMILGLGFPGGPIIDRRASSARGNAGAIDLPVSTLGPDSLDFSYSGLKTALLYAVRGAPKRRGNQSYFERDYTALSEAQIDDYCASFQRAAIAAILIKVERAIDQLRDAGPGARPRSIIVGGGVSANSRLRAELTSFAEARGLSLRLPRHEYCLDNAAMIAGAAHQRLARGEVDDFSLAPVAAGIY